jgi:hypothetical protein
MPSNNFDINGPVQGTNTTNPGAGTFGTTGVETVTSPTAAPTGDTAATPDAGGTNSSTSTASGGNTLSNGDLPWAPVALPTTSAGQGGLGEGKHGLKPETWVIGYFLDGEACQQPIITGVIAGGPGAGSGRGGVGGGNGGGSGGDGSGSGAVGSGEGLNTSGIKTTTNVGGNNSKKAFDLLVQNGYSPQNAAGILGNLVNEGTKGSGYDIDPNINQIGGGGGYGIAQWTDRSRKDGLKNFAGSKYNTIEGQTAYLIHELRTTEKKAEKLLQNSRESVDRSALAFLAFERPKGYNAQYAKAAGGQGYIPNSDLAKKRIASARSIYAKYGSGGGGTSSTPAAVSTPAASTSTPTLNSGSTGNFALTGITSK